MTPSAPLVDDDWLARLQRCRADNQPCVLVTLLAISASLPQHAGAKMLVTATASAGSVGGSAIERDAVAFARTLLADGGALTTAEFGSDAKATLLFEPFPANTFNVVVFGAGHVGSTLVGLLATLPCRTRWFDDRAGLLPQTPPPGVRAARYDDADAAVAAAPAGSCFILCSHSHRLDYRLAAAVLRRGDARFLGMLGSDRKRDGFARYAPVDDWRRRLVCPVGLPGIDGRSPGEIAVAIAAQLLLLPQERS